MSALWLTPSTLVQALALALLHSLGQVALLALLASVLLAATPRRGAALRHALAMGVLLAMLAIPAATFLHFLQEASAGALDGSLAPMTAVTALPGLSGGDAAALAALLSALWLGGVALMLLRHYGGWRLLASLEKAPHRLLPPPLQRRVLAMQGALGISRTVLVRLAEEVAAPFTARLWRPVIWLPLSLLAQLPVEQLEALIAHELAHIRRLDWLWNGLQCLVESLLFFHPGVWWLGRRIREERELACDDLAVAACGNAIALAEALAELERHRHPLPRLVLAAHGGSLMQRITRLLTGSTPNSRWRLPAVLVILLGSGAVLAAQVALSGNASPDSHFQSTTTGDLGPGDERVINFKDRHYRAVVDAKGKLTEEYTIAGKPQPIDAATRKWLDEMTHIAVAPPPPPPPPGVAPPPPPVLPPPPPAPPAPPVKQAGVADVTLPTPSAPPPVPPAPPAPPAPPVAPIKAVLPTPPAPPSQAALPTPPAVPAKPAAN
jgi:beta-lactamase regulating signal transducer with metallopeptidase domain